MDGKFLFADVTVLWSKPKSRKVAQRQISSVRLTARKIVDRCTYARNHRGRKETVVHMTQQEMLSWKQVFVSFWVRWCNLNPVFYSLSWRDKEVLLPETPDKSQLAVFVRQKPRWRHPTMSPVTQNSMVRLSQKSFANLDTAESLRNRHHALTFAFITCLYIWSARAKQFAYVVCGLRHPVKLHTSLHDILQWHFLYAFSFLQKGSDVRCEIVSPVPGS